MAHPASFPGVERMISTAGESSPAKRSISISLHCSVPMAASSAQWVRRRGGGWRTTRSRRRMHRVAEERTLAEDHPERARLSLDSHVAGVSADVEHRNVAGTWRRWIDYAAGAGVNTVGPDQEVSLRLGAVLEPRHDPVRRGPGIHEPLAVLDAGAAPTASSRSARRGRPLRVWLTVPSGRYRRWERRRGACRSHSGSLYAAWETL